MKRKNKQRRPSQKKTRRVSAHTSTTETEPQEPDRRSTLRLIRNSAIAGVVLGGGGWFVVREVEASMRETDLSQIGNGIPAIVQIHDPECPRCRALQREARAAVCEIGEENLQFLVANIRRENGRALANAHRVGHITLLLLDGAGNQRGILAGERESEELVEAFRAHVNRYGAKNEG